MKRKKGIIMSENTVVVDLIYPKHRLLSLFRYTTMYAVLFSVFSVISLISSPFSF